MRICLCIKGTFSLNDIRKGYDHTEAYNNKLHESLESIKKSLINPLLEQGHSVDIIFSTYDTSCSLIAENVLSPIKCYKFPNKGIYEHNIVKYKDPQLRHYKKLVELIRQSESEKNNKYDFFIFTRFDLIFIGKVTEWNINYNEFNIAMMHSSGNCDDNIWLFPSKDIENFELCVDELMDRKREGMTHEMNKVLNIKNVKINYIYIITQEDYDKNTCYKIFSFNRS